MERSARSRQLFQRQAGPGALLAQALGERGKRLVELHRPIVGPSCLRGKRICQSSRFRNIGETVPRSTVQAPPCRPDQGRKPVKGQVTPGTRAESDAVASRTAATPPGARATSSGKRRGIRPPRSGDLQVELQAPGRLAHPESLVRVARLCASRCAPGQVERVAVPVQHRQAAREPGEERVAMARPAAPPPTNRPRGRRPRVDRPPAARANSCAPRQTPSVGRRASASRRSATSAADWRTRRRSRPTSARPSPRHRRSPRRRDNGISGERAAHVGRIRRGECGTDGP